MKSNFYDEYLFLQIACNTWEQKYRVHDNYYVSNDYTDFRKIYEDYIEFDTEHPENIKSAERQKNSFPKE